MPSVAELRSDLLAFSIAVEWPLTSWQADALRLDKRTTAICAPRQSGKSRSLAVAALWTAFRKRDQHVLLVSAGDDAAKRLLAECAAVAQRSRLLKGSVVDEFAGLLSLTNGSRLVSLPASERRIRGETADCLVIDECALVPDELVLDACVPTTAARPDAKIVVASSPASPEGAFFDFVEQGEQGSPHVETFRWQLSDATWIEPAVVESAQQSLAPAAFRREFLAEFADTGIDERVIEREWIVQAQQRDLERLAGVPLFAVDVARHGGDETVITRIAGGRLRVVWAARGLQSIMPIAGQIEALSNAEATPPLFWIDADGIGWGVHDRCRQIGGLRVEAFQGGTAPRDSRRHLNKRAEAWWIAREALRQGEVDLPDDDRLLAAQLGQVTYSLDLAGRVVIQPKKAMRQSPDRGDSAVMAIWAAASAYRGEWIADFIERSRRDARKARQPLSTERQFGAQLPTEVEWSAPRGSWHERLDWSLDELPKI